MLIWFGLIRCLFHREIKGLIMIMLNRGSARLPPSFQKGQNRGKAPHANESGLELYQSKSSAKCGATGTHPARFQVAQGPPCSSEHKLKVPIKKAVRPETVLLLPQVSSTESQEPIAKRRAS